MKRSAFARGARTGLRMMRMSASVNTASKAVVNAVPVADQEPELGGAVTEVHAQVAGLLGHPHSGGMGGDPGDMYAATGVLDHDEHVEAAQQDGVDEVDREDRVGLRGEELSPGRSGPARSRIDAGALEDLPHGRRGDRVAEPDELAVDSAVAPPWVLPRHPQHQIANALRDRWTAGCSPWIGPAAGDELGMPAQQRAR